jgi:hypothetical protein
MGKEELLEGESPFSVCRSHPGSLRCLGRWPLD